MPRSTGFNQTLLEVISSLSSSCTSPPIIDDEEVEKVISSDKTLNMDKRVPIINCKLDTPIFKVEFSQKCLEALTKAVQKSIKVMDLEVVKCKDDIRRAAECKVKMVGHLSRFSEKFADFKNQEMSYLIETKLYQQKMATLLSLYLDFETLAARRGVEAKEVIIQRIKQTMRVNLDNCNDSNVYFSETLLQTLYFTDEINKAINIPIIRHVMETMTPSDKKDSLNVTIQRILMFRLWKYVEIEETSYKIISKAVKCIKLTRKFEEKLYDGAYSYILPQLNPLKRDKTVVSLMIAKFDLFMGIQAFVDSFFSLNGRKYPQLTKEKGKITSNDMESQNQNTCAMSQIPDIKFIKKELSEDELTDYFLNKNTESKMCAGSPWKAYKLNKILSRKGNTNPLQTVQRLLGKRMKRESGGKDKRKVKLNLGKRMKREICGNDKKKVKLNLGKRKKRQSDGNDKKKVKLTLGKKKKIESCGNNKKKLKVNTKFVEKQLSGAEMAERVIGKRTKRKIDKSAKNKFKLNSKFVKKEQIYEAELTKRVFGKRNKICDEKALKKLKPYERSEFLNKLKQNVEKVQKRYTKQDIEYTDRIKKKLDVQVFRINNNNNINNNNDGGGGDNNNNNNNNMYNNNNNNNMLHDNLEDSGHQNTINQPLSHELLVPNTANQPASHELVPAESYSSNVVYENDNADTVALLNNKNRNLVDKKVEVENANNYTPHEDLEDPNHQNTINEPAPCELSVPVVLYSSNVIENDNTDAVALLNNENGELVNRKVVVENTINYALHEDLEDSGHQNTIYQPASCDLSVPVVSNNSNIVGKNDNADTVALLNNENGELVNRKVVVGNAINYAPHEDLEDPNHQNTINEPASCELSVPVVLYSSNIIENDNTDTVVLLNNENGELVNRKLVVGNAINYAPHEDVEDPNHQNTVYQPASCELSVPVVLYSSNIIENDNTDTVALLNDNTDTVALLNNENGELVNRKLVVGNAINYAPHEDLEDSGYQNTVYQPASCELSVPVVSNNSNIVGENDNADTVELLNNENGELLDRKVVVENTTVVGNSDKSDNNMQFQELGDRTVNKNIELKACAASFWKEYKLNKIVSNKGNANPLQSVQSLNIKTSNVPISHVQDRNYDTKEMKGRNYDTKEIKGKELLANSEENNNPMLSDRMNNGSVGGMYSNKCLENTTALGSENCDINNMKNLNEKHSTSSNIWNMLFGDIKCEGIKFYTEEDGDTGMIFSSWKNENGPVQSPRNGSISAKTSTSTNLIIETNENTTSQPVSVNGSVPTTDTTMNLSCDKNRFSQFVCVHNSVAAATDTSRSLTGAKNDNGPIQSGTNEDVDTGKNFSSEKNEDGPTQSASLSDSVHEDGPAQSASLSDSVHEDGPTQSASLSGSVHAVTGTVTNLITARNEDRQQSVSQSGSPSTTETVENLASGRNGDKPSTSWSSVPAVTDIEEPINLSKKNYNGLIQSAVPLGKSVYTVTGAGTTTVVDTEKVGRMKSGKFKDNLLHDDSIISNVRLVTNTGRNFIREKNEFPQTGSQSSYFHVPTDTDRHFEPVREEYLRHDAQMGEPPQSFPQISYFHFPTGLGRQFTAHSEECLKQDAQMNTVKQNAMNVQSTVSEDVCENCNKRHTIFSNPAPDNYRGGDVYMENVRTEKNCVENAQVGSAGSVNGCTINNNVRNNDYVMGAYQNSASYVVDYPVNLCRTNMLSDLSIRNNAFHNKSVEVPAITLHSKTQHSCNEIIAVMSNILRSGKDNPNFNNQIFQLPMDLMNDPIQLTQYCSCNFCKLSISHVREFKTKIFNCYREKLNFGNYHRLQNVFNNGQEKNYNQFNFPSTQHMTSVSEQIVHSPSPSRFINVNEAVERGIFRPYSRVEPERSIFRPYSQVEPSSDTGNTCYITNTEIPRKASPEKVTLLSNYSNETHGSNSSIVRDANKSKIIRKIFNQNKCTMPNSKNTVKKSRKVGEQSGTLKKSTKAWPAGRVNYSNNTSDDQLKFSTNALPTGDADRTDILGERLGISTNTSTTGHMSSHTNNMSGEQLRFSMNTLLRSSVNNANVSSEQLGISANTLAAGHLNNHTNNTSGEQLKFSMNTVLTDDVNRTNTASERLGISTNTVPTGHLYHTNNTYSEQLRRFSMNTMPTDAVNHTDIFGEPFRFNTNTLPTDGVNSTNALGELRFRQESSKVLDVQLNDKMHLNAQNNKLTTDNKQNNDLLNRIPSSFSGASETVTQEVLPQGMLPPSLYESYLNLVSSLPHLSGTERFRMLFGVQNMVPSSQNSDCKSCNKESKKTAQTVNKTRDHQEYAKGIQNYNQIDGHGYHLVPQQCNKNMSTSQVPSNQDVNNNQFAKGRSKSKKKQAR